jgi:hypothetical protein
VRADFNLLDFIDVPGAFFCGPLTVQAGDAQGRRSVRRPYQSSMKVWRRSVWLVTWPNYGPIAGSITIAELESLPSLVKSTAATFEGDNQPLPTRPSRLVMNAQGAADGRSFLLAPRRTTSAAATRSVRIDVW